MSSVVTTRLKRALRPIVGLKPLPPMRCDLETGTRSGLLGGILRWVSGGGRGVWVDVTSR